MSWDTGRLNYFYKLYTAHDLAPWLTAGPQNTLSLVISAESRSSEQQTPEGHVLPWRTATPLPTPSLCPCSTVSLAVGRGAFSGHSPSPVFPISKWQPHSSGSQANTWESSSTPLPHSTSHLSENLPAVRVRRTSSEPLTPITLTTWLRPPSPSPGLPAGLPAPAHASHP